MPDQRDGDAQPRPLTIPSPEADALVAAARSGAFDAFAELYRASLPIVYGNLVGRTGDRALAEDLCSEAYVRAIRAVGRFDGGSSEFVAWVMRIARNLFLDHVKSGRVRWEMVVDEMPARPTSGDAADEAIATVEGLELRRALEQLTPEQQEVVHLRFLQGLPVADVARITGRAEGAVKAMQFRALRMLAKILAEPVRDGG